MRTAARALILLLLVPGLAACGGGDDDDQSSSEATESEESEESEEEVPFTGRITADELEGCLSDAGFDPEPYETNPLGVDDPFEAMRIELQGDRDEPFKAYFYVFSSAESAEHNRPAITLQNEDNDIQKVVDNVLLDYDVIPAFDTEGSAAAEGCLE